jgi:putative flippase GtrA
VSAATGQGTVQQGFFVIRWRQPTHPAMVKLVKYFITGAVAAGVDFVLFATFVKLLGWPWYIAATVSFVAATLTNYVLSIRHVFTSGVRFEKREEIAAIFLVSAIGLAVNQAILYFLIRAGVMVLVAKVGATGAVFLWNFGARHQFVFKEGLPPAGK